MACGCHDCIKRNGPQVGMEVYLKPDVALKQGKLPPNLSDSAKLGSFKVVASDDSTAEPSCALAMPDNVGNVIVVNGKKTNVWWVYNSDIYGTDKPNESTEKKPEKKVEKDKVEKKPEKVTEPAKIKVGDIVRPINPEHLPSSITKEELEQGFKVVGISYGALVIELPNDKGDHRDRYGTSTYSIRASDVNLVKSYTLKVGDYVRVTGTASANKLHGSINSSEHFQGFKILGLEGSEVVLEMPEKKGVINFGNYNGKYVSRVSLEHVELAPTMKYRKGDKVRLKKTWIPSRIPKKDHWKKVEISEVAGEFGSFQYTVKLPDGTDYQVNGEKVFDLKDSSVQEGSVSVKIKKGMKVSIKENRRHELPDSMDEADRSQIFEVLDYNERDDDVVLKMPRSCTEAEHDDDHDCRVWHMDVSSIEVKAKEVKDKMAKKVDRSSASVLERLQANAEQGAVKTVGRKLTKAAKAGILKGLESIAQSQGMDAGQVSAGLQLFRVFMESEKGNAIVSAILGQFLAQIAPKIPFPIFQDERVQDLADEMTSEGIAIIMESAVDVVMEHIAPSLGSILEGLPPKKEETTTKLRVATKKGPAKKKKSTVQVGKHEVEVEDDEDDEEEKETVHVSARARAN